MRTFTILIAAGLALPLCGQTTRTISRADLRDKIEGGWAGQMIGVSLRRAHRVPLPRADQSRRTACRCGSRRWSPTRSTRTISTSI